MTDYPLTDPDDPRATMHGEVSERDTAIARLRHVAFTLRKRADEWSLLADFLEMLDKADQLPDDVEVILWKIAMNMS